MCLLCFVPPKKWPKKKHLENACASNPDGFGFSINLGNKIITRKSMNSKELIEEFFDLRNDNKDSAALFHARLATHGTRDINNCHPFDVDNDDKIVMAHNGILPVMMDKNDWRSDTRVFAEEYMSTIGIKMLDDPIGNDIISEYCNGSKLVFLNASDKLDKEWYIINESSGMYEKDIWYSNAGYKGKPKYLGIKPYTTQFYNNIVGTNKDDFYEDEDYCSICFDSFYDLPDEKFLSGCNECGMSANQVCDIYNSWCYKEGYYDDQESAVTGIHSRPLSEDWSKPLV